jgi:hypothetical protein
MPQIKRIMLEPLRIAAPVVQRQELTDDQYIQNATPIVIDPDEARAGLKAPRNLGPCSLVIFPFDRNGRPIKGGELRLEPGTGIPFYVPPQGTAKIMAMHDYYAENPRRPGCRPILEWETQDWDKFKRG